MTSQNCAADNFITSYAGLGMQISPNCLQRFTADDSQLAILIVKTHNDRVMMSGKGIGMSISVNTDQTAPLGAV